jgi:hypothetical protein
MIRDYPLFLVPVLLCASCQQEESPTQQNALPAQSSEVARFKKLYSEFLDEAQTLKNLLDRVADIEVLNNQMNVCEIAHARFAHMSSLPGTEMLILSGGTLNTFLAINIVSHGYSYRAGDVLSPKDQASASKELARCRKALGNLR